MELNLGLRDELRLHGSGILGALEIFGINYDTDQLNHLYTTLLIAKAIDVTCNVRWLAFTRFMTADYEFIDTFGKRRLKDCEVALYHHGNGVYSRNKKDYLAMIVWKKKPIEPAKKGDLT